MTVDSPDKIRNVALAGHNDTGKTTLASGLLYTSGAVNRMGRVEEKSAPTDFDPEEHSRGISLGTAVCFAPWKQHKINLIDCPGYGIFFSETMAGMRAADSTLLCISAVSGVEVTTEKVWEFAEELQQPVIFHLTKMDRERADFERAVGTLQARFGRGAAPVQFPLGKEAQFAGIVDLVTLKAQVYDRDGTGKAKQVDLPNDIAREVDVWRAKLVEAVAETDDTLMERFFETGTLPHEDMVKGLHRAIRERRIFPVTMSAAAHGIGTGSCSTTSSTSLRRPTSVRRLRRPAWAVSRSRSLSTRRRRWPRSFSRR